MRFFSWLLALATAFTSPATADTLVGTWQGTTAGFTVMADGSYTWRAPSGPLQGQAIVQGNALRFMVKNVAQPYFVDYRFQLAGNGLRLQDIYGNITSFQRGRASTPPPRVVTPQPHTTTNQPVTKRGTASVAQSEAFLALLKGYPGMAPAQVLAGYDALTPDQREYLAIFSNLHGDLTKKTCPASRGRVFQGMGERWNCAELLRQEQEARGLMASMGLAYTGNQGKVASQRTSVVLSIECRLGKTAKSDCKSWNTLQHNLNTQNHVTNMNIIENMGSQRQREWKVVPGN